MRHRIKNGVDTWNGENASLAAGRINAAPPARASQLLTFADHVVAADARLDNAKELAEILGLSGEENCAPRLLLAAFLRWGVDCPNHLLGDFVFAIWDRGSRTLFCARDHFGVKPFYYTQSTSAFAGGSEIKAVTALLPGRREINEGAIAELLAGAVCDDRSTTLKQVFRLPPAHWLHLDASGRLDIQRYWRLDVAEAPQKNAAEAFAALFEEAVRCRTEGGGRVGAFLSGGLDSSSVACIARNLRPGTALPTVSLVFDATPQWSERPFIDTVLQTGGFDPALVSGDDHAPFADADALFDEQDGFFAAPALALSRQTCRAAAAHGVDVVLDGHGGDEIISYGYGRLAELAYAENWLSLLAESRGVAALLSQPAMPIVTGYLRNYSRLWKKAGRVKQRLFPAQGRQGARETPSSLRHINQDLARATKLDEKLQAMFHAASPPSEHRDHLAAVTSPMQAYGFEVLDKQVAHAGIEARYPFWDKRVVEFCVSLPAREKLSNGWTRSILRRGMEGVLPSAIQWRRTKLDFGRLIATGMRRRHADLLHSLLHDEAERLRPFLDVAAIQGALRRVLEQGDRCDGFDMLDVWRAAMLCLWLKARASETDSDAPRSCAA